MTTSITIGQSQREKRNWRAGCDESRTSGSGGGQGKRQQCLACGLPHWKLPLPEFIAECYRKRFHRERPAKVVPLAEVAQRQQASARDKARHPRERTDT